MFVLFKEIVNDLATKALPRKTMTAFLVQAKFIFNLCSLIILPRTVYFYLPASTSQNPQNQFSGRFGLRVMWFFDNP